YTTVYKVFAKWADDGSLWRAFVASVGHLAGEKQIHLSGVPGGGAKTRGKKRGVASANRGTNHKKGARACPLPTTKAPEWHPCPWHPSMRRTWFCCPRGCKR